MTDDQETEFMTNEEEIEFHRGFIEANLLDLRDWFMVQINKAEEKNEKCTFDIRLIEEYKNCWDFHDVMMTTMINFLAWRKKMGHDAEMKYSELEF